MMSQERFKMVFAGMSSSAQKVYSSVPIADAWSVQQIVAELLRCGISQDRRIVLGCLNTLCSAGLVDESSKGMFIREGIREVIAKKIAGEEMKQATTAITATAAAPATSTKAVSKHQDPMDILGALATRAVHMANSLKELASDISDAALAIQGQIEASEADMTKLRQLQALLKGLT